MFKSRIFWSIILGVLTSTSLALAVRDLPYNPLRDRITDALALPGAFLSAHIYPQGVHPGGGSQLWAALVIALNFLIYVFFWYACLWLIRYLRARRHPYDRGATLVPPSLR